MKFFARKLLKNVKNKVLMAVVFLLLAGVFTGAINIPYVNYAKDVVLYMYDGLTNGTIKNLIFEKTPDKIMSFVNELESDELSAFTEAGGEFIITTDKNLIENSILENVNGYFEPETLTIYLSNKLPCEVGTVAVHELGHAVDYMNGNLSDNEPFLSVAADEFSYCTDILSLMNGSHVKDDDLKSGDYHEYFAESYMNYYLFPHFLKSSAPKTYEYFETLLD